MLNYCSIELKVGLKWTAACSGCSETAQILVLTECYIYFIVLNCSVMRVESASVAAIKFWPGCWAAAAAAGWSHVPCPESSSATAPAWWLPFGAPAPARGGLSESSLVRAPSLAQPWQPLSLSLAELRWRHPRAPINCVMHPSRFHLSCIPSTIIWGITPIRGDMIMVINLSIYQIYNEYIFSMK